MKFLGIPQSGKIGMEVAQQGRFGQIKRSLGLTANPRTPKQTAVRRIFASVAARWRTLQTAQQEAWNAAAKNYLSAPKCGQSGPLTGCQLFVKQNAILATFGQDAVDLPAPKPQFLPLAVTGLTITNNAGVIALKLDTVGNPGEATVIRGAAPQSNGRFSVPTCQILGMCPAPVANASDITDLYTAVHGVLAHGDKVFIQATQVLAGHEDIPVTFTATVPAGA
jgi:hypothetical protein